MTQSTQIEQSSLPSTINTLWFGESLGYLERLSIASFLANGHDVNLFSYQLDSLKGVPPGVSLYDARDVMSDPKRLSLFEGKFKAFGSDFFRYEIFAQELGYWSDLDVILLRPLEFANDYVFGWENDRISINGAVLRLPNGSFLQALRTIPEKNWCPPFFGPRRKLLYYIKRLTGDVGLEDLPWGATCPGMITYLAKTHGLLDSAQPREVFYPIPYTRAESLYENASVVDDMVHPETIAIHMWHSRLKHLATNPPPPGSFIAKMCNKYKVDNVFSE